MKMKLVEKDNLHISLKFLGDLNFKEIDKTSTILHHFSTKYQPFRVGLSKSVSFFPNITRPRIAWIGIEKGDNIILNMHQIIENELKSEQFYKEENKFKAHITLARIKYLKQPNKLNCYIKSIKIKPLTFYVKTIELMESQLTSEGPIYKIITSFPLLIQI